MAVFFINELSSQGIKMSKLSAIDRANIVSSLEEFTKYMFKAQKGSDFIVSWHHKLICETLEKVITGQITRLIINIPPRYSKTEIAVVNFMAWCIGLFPDCEFIHASYSARLAANNAYKARSIAMSEEFKELFPYLELKNDSKAKDDWRTEKGGIVYATGAGGTITGFGAGKIRPGFAGAVIIDDPLKAGDANSDTVRTGVNEWFVETMESRLNKKETPIIVIMQRLHEDDLSGFLLGGGNGEKWDHLMLPAIGSDGKPLWPFKHPIEELNRMETANPYMFAGQYMQTPSPKGGGLFKDEWWKYYRVNGLPELKYQFITADTAQKTKEQNDFSVIQCWGVDKTGQNIYLLDMVRGKWEAPDLRQQMLSFYGKQTQRMRVRTVYIEDKSSGSSLIQELKRGSSLPIKPVQRNTDKVSRAYDVVDFIAAGRVWLPEGEGFVSDILRESSQFPLGKNDDCLDPLMDAIDQGLALANRKGSVKVRLG